MQNINTNTATLRAEMYRLETKIIKTNDAITKLNADIIELRSPN